jgi:hypothetical protein
MRSDVLSGPQRPLRENTSVLTALALSTPGYAEKCVPTFSADLRVLCAKHTCVDGTRAEHAEVRGENVAASDGVIGRPDQLRLAKQQLFGGRLSAKRGAQPLNRWADAADDRGVSDGALVR